jgi:hypothetical protein
LAALSAVAAAFGADQISDKVALTDGFSAGLVGAAAVAAAGAVLAGIWMRTPAQPMEDTPSADAGTGEPSTVDA